MSVSDASVALTVTPGLCHPDITRYSSPTTKPLLLKLVQRCSDFTLCALPNTSGHIALFNLIVSLVLGDNAVNALVKEKFVFL